MSEWSDCADKEMADVLDEMQLLVDTYGLSCIGTEHFLLALLRVPQSAVGRMLKSEFGLEESRV
ncbi:MAG: Clp protease N-terminal domain-containing protein, partial [Christensenellaceae bacterium]